MVIIMVHGFMAQGSRDPAQAAKNKKQLSTWINNLDIHFFDPRFHLPPLPLFSNHPTKPWTAQIGLSRIGRRIFQMPALSLLRRKEEEGHLPQQEISSARVLRASLLCSLPLAGLKQISQMEAKKIEGDSSTKT